MVPRAKGTALALMALAACGRIRFDPFETSSRDASDGDSNALDDAGGPDALSLDAAPACLLGDPCSPCTGTVSQVTTTSTVTSSTNGGSIGPIEPARHGAVWTGSEYALVWSDTRDNGMFPPEIYMARLNAAGAQIGADIRLTTAAGSSHSPAIHWTGFDYVVVWGDDRTNYVIAVNRFNTAGAPLDTETLVPGIFGPHNPSIAAEPGGFRVAYIDSPNATNREVYWFRIDTNLGVIAAPTAIHSTGESRGTSLAFNGSQFALGIESSFVGNHATYLKRYNAAGGSLGQTTLTSTAPFTLPQHTVTLWNGIEWVIAWPERRTDRGIYLRRVGTDGIAVGSEAYVIGHGAGAFAPSLVQAGFGYGLAWIDQRDGNDELYFAKLDANGALATPEIRVTQTAAAAMSPVLMNANGQFAIAWTEVPSLGAPANMFFTILTCP